MTSTTARYPIKTKTLSLLELCQTMSDFRHPPPLPPSISSYQFQASSTATQILTRRLYLHPLTINANQKQQSSKIPTSPDNEQRQQLNRDTNQTKTKSLYNGLAILSSSFPLTTRLNSKPETRNSRDKISIKSDDEIISNNDNNSIITNPYHQSSLLSIARGTTSSTHKMCTRLSCLKNHQRIYPTVKKHWERVNVWDNFDRVLQRPIPTDPPTTPLSIASSLNTKTDDIENQYFNHNSVINENTDDDDYMYNED